MQYHAPEVANLIHQRDEPSSFVLSLAFNLVSHVGATARRFATLEREGAERLSLRNWSRGVNTPGPLIIRYDLQRRERSASFVRLAIRILAGSLLGDDVQDNADSQTWILLDEATRFGRCDALLDLAALGRSRGVRMIASVQSPAQLRDVYGEAGAEAFRENFGLTVVCAVSPGDNAKRLSDVWIGQRTVAQPERLIQKGNDRREWTIPCLSTVELSGEFGLRFDLWGKPYIRAAILGLSKIPILDWSIDRLTKS